MTPLTPRPVGRDDNMTTNDPGGRIAFWLLPEEGAHRLLAEQIARCAERLGAPRFEPHLTLLALPAAALPAPEPLLRSVAEQTAPLALDCSGRAQSSARYNRALTLPIALSPGLARLVAALHPRHQVPDDYAPHVSLAYADLDPETGRALAREFSTSPRIIRFDRCRAVDIGPGCRRADDVRNWRTVASFALTGDVAAHP